MQLLAQLPDSGEREKEKKTQIFILLFENISFGDIENSEKVPRELTLADSFTR